MPKHSNTPTAVPPVQVNVLQQKFQAAFQQMDATLVERTQALQVIFTALIAQEHPFLLGPPGTAKSTMLRILCQWVEGKFFPYVLSKATDPTEIVGNISIKTLREEDRVVRQVKDTIADCHIAFIDEVFKGSSFVQNLFLVLMNERKFKAGPGVELDVPLRMLASASNEGPGAGDATVANELSALWDRYLFRVYVPYVQTRESLYRLVARKNLIPQLSTRLTLAELDQAHQEARSLAHSRDVENGLVKIYYALRDQGITVSDRRLVWAAQKALPAYAYFCGANEVRQEHLEILQHCLWDDCSQEVRQKVAATVIQVANPVAAEMNTILEAVREQVAKVDFANPAFNVIAPVMTKLEGLIRDLRKLGKLPMVCNALRHVHQQYNQIHALIVKKDHLMPEDDWESKV
jgi:MoxR-like ATPase